MERISVIVPVYGVEAYLDRCIRSIVEQTYDNLEIILVDDGSRDGCPAICDAWARRDSRIKVLHRQNGGLSDARNAGMAAATGELLGFVDGDDWIDSDMYRQLYEHMTRTRSDIAACGVEMNWDDGTPPRMLTGAGHCVLKREEALRALLEESRLKQPVWYKLYKTDLVRDLTFPVGKYHEDVFWSYRAVGRAEQVAVFDTVGYHYTQRAGSIMGEAYSLKRLDALEAQAACAAYMRAHAPGLSQLALCSLWSGCIYAMQMCLRRCTPAVRRDAEAKIRGILRENPLLPGTVGAVPARQRMWLLLACMALVPTCRCRNWLGIGM